MTAFRFSMPTLVRRLLQITIAVVLVFVFLLGYATLAERRAEARARAFCESTRIGESPAALLERAKAAGADERQTRWLKVKDRDPWLPVTFTGVFPLSRHICSVEAAEKVKRAEYVYLD